MSNTKQLNRLPYTYYTVPVFILLLLGFADTSYLAYSHYQNYTNIVFSSFCALSKSINCDTVSQSPWSIFLGLPLAIWGFFAYLLFFVLFLGTLRNSKDVKTIWYLIFLLGAAYTLASLYFGYISATKIKAYCILCLTSYAINFSLWFASWIIIRRFGSGKFWRGVGDGVHQIFRSKLVTGNIVGIAGLVICLKLFLPAYWQFDFPESSTAIDHGLTEEGNPWIGAKEPVLTIEEYSDYQCFQCKKMHFMLRQLISEYPDKIRLIHHHYPMDHTVNSIIVPTPFHVGSAKMAYLGIYAAYNDKFWLMNDALYQLGEKSENFNTKIIADKTDFTAGELSMAIKNPTIRTILLKDIRRGMQLEITATPTFVINNEKYVGSIPPKIFDGIIE